MREYIKNQPKTCTVDNCNKPTRAKGFCTLHYDRFHKNGDPLITTVIRNGQTKKPEYRIWNGMIQRCTNKKTKFYYRYGGRGIKVCDRWLNSFLSFYEDMGPRPSNKHEIDRKKNNGNYEKSNCRWILHKENMINSTSTKLNLEKAREIRRLYKDEKHSRAEICKIFNIAECTVSRITHGKIWVESES